MQNKLDLHDTVVKYWVMNCSNIWGQTTTEFWERFCRAWTTSCTAGRTAEAWGWRKACVWEERSRKTRESKVLLSLFIL